MEVLELHLKKIYYSCSCFCVSTAEFICGRVWRSLNHPGGATRLGWKWPADSAAAGGSATHETSRINSDLGLHHWHTTHWEVCGPVRCSLQGGDH